MTAAASEQTRRNRVAGARKAAAVRKARAAQAEPLRTGQYGPDGPVRGSTPMIFSISEVLQRVRQRQGQPQ